MIMIWGDEREHVPVSNTPQVASDQCTCTSDTSPARLHQAADRNQRDGDSMEAGRTLGQFIP